MRGRTLGLLWVLAGVIFFVLGYWGVTAWRSLLARGQAAAAQRAALTGEIRAKQDEMVKEMRSTNVLQEMQFSVERADPSVFLTGLADLTQGTRVRVLAISPLERQTTPQFIKSWQTVQLISPFHDLRELATRVEREKGILEDLSVDVPPAGAALPGQPPSPGAAVDVQAKFKLTSMEVTGEAKRILQRALAVTRTIPGPTPQPEPSLQLPFPPRPTATASAARDPFLFAAPALPPVPKATPPVRAVAGVRPPAGPPPDRPFQITVPPVASAPTSPVAMPSEPRPLAPMEVKGIVAMPDGYLAIVNNEIVKAGDTIENHRVERVTATDVVLRQPDGTLRSLTLPSIVTRSPARR